MCISIVKNVYIESYFEEMNKILGIINCIQFIYVRDPEQVITICPNNNFDNTIPMLIENCFIFAHDPTQLE